MQLTIMQGIPSFLVLFVTSFRLCVHSLLEHTDVTIMYDNEALYDICRRNLAGSLWVHRPPRGRPSGRPSLSY